MKIYNSVDLTCKEVKNVTLETSAPSTPATGTIYLDTDNDQIRYWNGSEWTSIGGSSGGGGGGEVNILDQVGININNSNTTPNLLVRDKTVKLGFSSPSLGNLQIKDLNDNRVLGTVNIGSSGLTAGSIIACGSLTAGYSTYVLEHSLGTNNVIVQVIDNNGATVGCEVTRFTDVETGTNRVRITFSSATSVSYRVIMVGSPNYSTLTLRSQTT